MRSISSVIPAVLAPLVRPAPLSSGKVQFAWQAAVGPAMERATSVRLVEGVLVVEAASAQWALEVRRSSSVILSRLQAFLGEAVTRIEVRRR